MSGCARGRAADTTPGGPAQTRAETAASTEAEAGAKAEAIEVERQAAADRWAATQREAAQRRADALAAESVRQSFRVTVTSPNGTLTHDEVVPKDEVVERVAALEFVTEQLPGWAVTAEPVT